MSEGTERLTRAKAIRAKCLDCMCGNSAEVRRCPLKSCALWRFRMGNERKGMDMPDGCGDENTPKNAGSESEEGEG